MYNRPLARYSSWISVPLVVMVISGSIVPSGGSTATVPSRSGGGAGTGVALFLGASAADSASGANIKIVSNTRRRRMGILSGVRG